MRDDINYLKELVKKQSADYTDLIIAQWPKWKRELVGMSDEKAFEIRIGAFAARIKSAGFTAEDFIKGCHVMQKAGYSIKDLTTETGCDKIVKVRQSMFRDIQKLHKLKRRHEEQDTHESADMVFMYQAKIYLLKKYYDMLGE